MNAPVRAAGGGRKSSGPASGKSSITRLLPPDELRDEYAIKIWKQQSKVLIERGILEPEDGPILMAYCNTFSLMIKADQVISKEGITADTVDSIKKHPAIAVRNDCVSQLARLGSLLGLDPLSRSRFMGARGPGGGGPKGNEFDEF